MGTLVRKELEKWKDSLGDEFSEDDVELVLDTLIVLDEQVRAI